MLTFKIYVDCLLLYLHLFVVAYDCDSCMTLILDYDSLANGIQCAGGEV